MKQKFTISIFLVLLLLVVGCGPVDPRYELFDADADKLGSIGLHGDTDTLATELSELFKETTNPKLHPEEFSYYTRISDDGERLLVLMQMPKLKKVEKDGRAEVVDIVEAWHEESPAIADKALYLGVKGNYTWMITKVPGAEADNSIIASKQDLYDFYGPREKFEKPEGK